MRVLVACEYSGTVRDAFENAGWDAWSCDLLPTESEQTKASGKHVQGNVLHLLHENWDLMIAHPPCTYLSFAATLSWNNKGRVYKRLEALKFFADLWECDIPHICIENPKGCASPVIAKYSQQIQPYFWGDPFIKTTWLWLKNLPMLTYYKDGDLFNSKSVVEPKGYWVNASGNYKIKRFVPTKEIKGLNNSKERARFFPGIARAMAGQWTDYLKNNARVTNE
jgi:hypothetical protein